MDVEKTIEFILEMQVKHEVNFAKHEEMIARIDTRLDRAILYGVREARNERRKRRELAASLQRLSEAQERTQEVVQELSRTVDTFLKARRNGGNGHAPA